MASFTLFIGPYMVYYLIKQIKKGNKEGVYLIAGLILLTIFSLLDMATSRGFIHTPHISSFVFFTFCDGHCGDNGK